MIVSGPARLHFSRRRFRASKTPLQHHYPPRTILRGQGSKQNPKILTVIQYPASNQVQTTNLDETKDRNSLSSRYGKDAVAFTFSMAEGLRHSTTERLVARKKSESTHDIDEVGSKSSSMTIQLNHWIYVKANSIVRHFMPANHPQSVAAGYDRFAMASFFASIAGSAGMVLSTQVCSLQ